MPNVTISNNNQVFKGRIGLDPCVNGSRSMYELVKDDIMVVTKIGIMSAQNASK